MDIKYLKLENDGLKEKERLIKEQNQSLKKQILKLKDQVESLERNTGKDIQMKEFEQQIQRIK